MLRQDKERIVAELTEQLRSASTLLVADYRGLTHAQLETLRAELREHGARLRVVKNTLTRRAAELAGADALLVLLEGPTAIAFVESEGDPAAVAKALAAAARETNVLVLRGGVLEGRTLSSEEVAELATLPPLEILRGQVLGAIVAPVTQLLALVSAPLRDLVGLLDARIAQLEGGGDGRDSGASAPEGGEAREPAAAASAAVPSEPRDDTSAGLASAEPATRGDGEPAQSDVQEEEHEEEE
ncbi:MAG: 50S ribosomal protein L10 [Thermoleophilia bacterium]|nr:50S ribosomal protein L10 [Gaiellaceae bacterium]MDW8338360.1 50S ribosomal protein L10 [Thermoleophilia bacterium]